MKFGVNGLGGHNSKGVEWLWQYCSGCFSLNERKGFDDNGCKATNSRIMKIENNFKWKKV